MSFVRNLLRPTTEKSAPTKPVIEKEQELQEVQPDYSFTFDEIVIPYAPLAKEEAKEKAGKPAKIIQSSTSNMRALFELQGQLLDENRDYAQKQEVFTAAIAKAHHEEEIAKDETAKEQSAKNTADLATYLTDITDKHQRTVENIEKEQVKALNFYLENSKHDSNALHHPMIRNCVNYTLLFKLDPLRFAPKQPVVEDLLNLDALEALNRSTI